MPETNLGQCLKLKPLYFLSSFISYTRYITYVGEYTWHDPVDERVLVSTQWHDLVVDERVLVSTRGMTPLLMRVLVSTQCHDPVVDESPSEYTMA